MSDAIEDPSTLHPAGELLTIHLISLPGFQRSCRKVRIGAYSGQIRIQQVVLQCLLGRSHFKHKQRVLVVPRGAQSERNVQTYSLVLPIRSSKWISSFRLWLDCRDWESVCAQLRDEGGRIVSSTPIQEEPTPVNTPYDEAAMSTSEVVGSVTTGRTSVATVDMKLEVVVIPVSDVDEKFLHEAWVATRRRFQLPEWAGLAPHRCAD